MPPREIVEVDDSAFPLIFVEMSPILTDAAITSMFDGFDRLLARNARFSAVIDTTPLTRFPEAKERKRITEWMKQRIVAEAMFNLGNAMVVNSGPARAAIAAVNWLRRPVNPQAAFASRWEAVDWCCERLRNGGIALGPAVLARRDAEHAKGGREAAGVEVESGRRAQGGE